ncbi:MAG: ribonuclease HII, partial [Oscillospiraceae bacterium]
GIDLLCGVDEAGRGPLAGDVYAAAVILPLDCEIEGINDSKKLSEKKRELLYDEIMEKAISVGVGVATVEEIDSINILNATFLAMQRAVSNLSVTPKLVLVDGNQNPRLNVHSRLVIKGDATSANIAAASIIAKVSRDRYMKSLDEKYSQYCFSKHKGYGTPLHYEKILQYGVCDVHRKTFLKNLDEKTVNVGKLGEDTAIKFLASNGYVILQRNFSCPYGEIDILAKKDNILSVVEVKTRKQKGTAAIAVTISKQKKIIKTYEYYESKNVTNLQPRFDVIEVYINKNKVENINFIENAF